MTEPDIDFDADVSRVRALFVSGRWHEAREWAQHSLRKGPVSMAMQRLVADMLAPEVLGVKSKNVQPLWWQDIANHFDTLRRSAVPYDEAVRKLAGAYRQSESAVERALRHANKIKKNPLPPGGIFTE